MRGGFCCLAIFGHSHRYGEQRDHGQILLNPGGCGQKQFALPLTMAVLFIEEDGSFRIESVDIPWEKTAPDLPAEEGLCVQMMHIGAFDDESVSAARMDRYLEEKGYQNDLSGERFRHESYLSDARKVPPERRRTVIRHPIRKAA